MISNALSLMILLPLLGAIVSFFVGTKAKFVALIASLAPLVLSLQMYMEFDKSSTMMQFVESYNWVPSIGVKYTLGVDGIGFPLVLLSTIVTVLVIIYSWGETKKPNQYFALLLLNEVGVLGVFTALDFFLFYIFWEIVLIPMFFLIGSWGGRKGLCSNQVLHLHPRGQPGDAPGDIRSVFHLPAAGGSKPLIC
ncbi:MAG: hypothetical protein AAGG66_10620 [Methanothrix soehngenii]|jgi:NADH-quinone oxidoreductase subunit M|uniref:hypothetical protein n=1 Tax=Methanothrix soehngenii TaxID=2223 RepID=UPI0031413A27